MAERGLLWRWLIEAQEAGEPVALLIVSDSVGSSPGKIGAKMALTAKSSIGTIGGGMVEAGLMKTARAMLEKGDTEPQILRRAHHPSKTVRPSGMICGGEQTVLIYPCSKDDRALFKQLFESCRLGIPLGYCVSRLGLQVLPPAKSGTKPNFQGGERWNYRETMGLYKRAYIIGAGHVGLALSKLLEMLDFDITLIDDGERVESMRANGYAQQIRRISYSDIAEHIPEGADVFVFIMTDCHQSDERVLSKLAAKQVAYIGMLGSRHKIARLKQALSPKIPIDQLIRLHAPMGLFIDSHTPEEIAISIAAELVQLLNSGR